jgi:hypothetical protein
MRWNGTKFGLDQNFEFKKSFKLYRQILLKVLAKSWLNFHPFCMDENERTLNITIKQFQFGAS